MKKKRQSKSVMPGKGKKPSTGLNKKATHKLPRIRKVSEIFEPGVGDNY